MASANARYSDSFSYGRIGNDCDIRPCFSAFAATFLFPRAVLGPVDFCALRRFTASLRGETGLRFATDLRLATTLRFDDGLDCNAMTISFEICPQRPRPARARRTAT